MGPGWRVMIEGGSELRPRMGSEDGWNRRVREER